jgi:dTMP kinase
MFRGSSRGGIFGLALVCAGASLALLALIPNLIIALVMTLVLGACAGLAWVTGFTTLGTQVEDEVRGRTFAFVQSLVRITLISVLAVAPLIAAAIGTHVIHLGSGVVHYNGAEGTLLLGGLFALGIGALSYFQMRDGKGS